VLLDPLALSKSAQTLNLVITVVVKNRQWRSKGGGGTENTHSGAQALKRINTLYLAI